MQEQGDTLQTKKQQPASAGSQRAGASGIFLQDNRSGTVAQQMQVNALANRSTEAPVQKKANTTGLPDTLKSGIENLSGHSMDDVKVHYNSSQPAQLNAHAYAQGTQIHIASGQEKHLPHEAWHVVQQKQGRVKPTMQMKGKVNINDDQGLEKEADVMGAKAVAPVQKKELAGALNKNSSNKGETMQRMIVSPVIQLARALNEEETTAFESCKEALEHFDDVLSFSSSIPPRLPKAFFPLFAEADTIVNEIHEKKEVEDESVIENLKKMCRDLEEMMYEAKEVAANDRAAIVPGKYRPPSKVSPLRPDTAATRAMEQAQETNGMISGSSTFEENMAILSENKSAVFFVIGKSAMGQGDTAFIVRTVTLLRSLGFTAIGVKNDAEAHDVGSSFDKSVDFIQPKTMIEEAKKADFIIEGPLSDHVSMDPHKTTAMDLMEGFSVDPRLINNLRLYEYGTLTYRGGIQAREQSAANKAVNVVSHARDPRHAFMGMGHGEIGAFYNAGSTKKAVPLMDALVENADTNHTSAVLLELLGTSPDAHIFIGYANKYDSVVAWANAVNQVMQKRGQQAIIVGVYGGKNPSGKYKIPSDNSQLIFDRKKEKGEKGVIGKRINPDAAASVVMTNSLPAEVMNALQKKAQPFTLSTGNYSLSEAIENGHMPSYETLDFNAGVSVAFTAQVDAAVKKIQMPRGLAKSIIALSDASPENLPRMTEDIENVLQHKHEVKLVMAVIKANTDIKETLVARLATLIK